MSFNLDSSCCFSSRWLSVTSFLLPDFDNVRTVITSTHKYTGPDYNLQTLHPINTPTVYARTNKYAQVKDVSAKKCDTDPHLRHGLGVEAPLSLFDLGAPHTCFSTLSYMTIDPATATLKDA